MQSAHITKCTCCKVDMLQSAKDKVTSNPHYILRFPSYTLHLKHSINLSSLNLRNLWKFNQRNYLTIDWKIFSNLYIRNLQKIDKEKLSNWHKKDCTGCKLQVFQSTHVATYTCCKVNMLQSAYVTQCRCCKVQEICKNLFKPLFKKSLNK